MISQDDIDAFSGEDSEMTDVEVKWKWEEYKRLLEGKSAKVAFTKVNGNLRVMRCTLQKDALPKATKVDPMSQKKIRELNYEVLSVWDLDAEGWRSFRIRNVESFIMVEDNRTDHCWPDLEEDLLGYGNDKFCDESCFCQNGNYIK